MTKPVLFFCFLFGCFSIDSATFITLAPKLYRQALEVVFVVLRGVDVLPEVGNRAILDAS